MALNLASFRAAHPEFEDASDALVQAKLDQAERSLDAVVFGDHFDDAHGQKAAHLLALSPEGQEAGLRMGGGANQQTVYQGELERLSRICGGSYRTVLD